MTGPAGRMERGALAQYGALFGGAFSFLRISVDE